MWLWRNSYNRYYKIVLVSAYSGNLWLLALAAHLLISPRINEINRNSFQRHERKAQLIKIAAF